MSNDYPPAFLRRAHMRGCDGDLHRLPDLLCVDRTGRVGNGGIICHEYVCNRRWAGCKARVLVTERAVRLLAVAVERRAS